MKLCASSRFPFVCLRDCGEIVTGSTPRKANSEFWGGEIPFVTPAQLGFQPPITTADEYVTREGADRGRLLPVGAVLVCCIGSLGKTGIAGAPLISNQQINAIIFDPIRVNTRYGYHAAVCLAPLLEHFAPSTTVKIVKKSTFAEFQIPCPTLPEQKRIAQILDAADALRAKRREALAQLDTLLQSTFLDMFGDPVTNPDGMGWNEHLGNYRYRMVSASLVWSPSDQGNSFGTARSSYLSDAITVTRSIRLLRCKEEVHASTSSRLLLNSCVAEDLSHLSWKRKLVNWSASGHTRTELVGKVCVFPGRHNDWLFNNRPYACSVSAAYLQHIWLYPMRVSFPKGAALNVVKRTSQRYPQA